MDELEKAARDVSEGGRKGRSRLVILGPVSAEVYVDDERRASVGSSGKVVLTDIPPGRHILRVSKPGERDDERVIEIRDDAAEQVIQAQLRAMHPSHPSHAGSSAGGSSADNQSVIPGIVACSNCGSRFAEGVRFCGRCGGGTFQPDRARRDADPTLPAMRQYTTYGQSLLRPMRALQCTGNPAGSELRIAARKHTASG